MPDLLEFEEPIGELLKEIEALSTLEPSAERDQEIARLESRVNAMRGDLYRNLTPWQRVQVARHPSRPTTLDYVERLFTEFVELHGDRRFADDHAIVTGTALYKDQPILVVGHQKGSDTKQKIYRNFGYARPDGYRKAMRTMAMAQKFKRPIICFVDTPAAYPGIESEERGVAPVEVRRQAVDRLRDQRSLATVVREDADPAVRAAALGHIRDETVLTEIAVSEPEKNADSMISAPSIWTPLRSAIDSSLLHTPSTIVTSEASRPTSSPLRRSWNHASGRASTRSKTMPRRSATTRSPSQLSV